MPVFCAVPDELISRSELLQMLGLSENSRYSHFDRLSKQEGFPAPVDTGGGRGRQKAWKRDDIEQWLSIHEENRIVLNGIEYLSDVDVCRQIDRSRWTLYKWVKNGKLPQPDFRLRQGKTKRYWRIETLKECGLDVS